VGSPSATRSESSAINELGRYPDYYGDSSETNITDVTESSSGGKLQDRGSQHTQQPVLRSVVVRDQPRLASESVSGAKHEAEAVLAQALDRFVQDLNNELENRSHAISSVNFEITGSTVLLSAGYLTWLLRGGSLLASVLATMPTWRNFDPLPILMKTRTRKEDVAAQDEKDDAESASEELSAAILLSGQENQEDGT
jgi:hypothetical protein